MAERLIVGIIGCMSKRLFLFTDIHANLPALQAIQRAVSIEMPDLVIHLGDAVDMGPNPAQVLSALAEQPDWMCLQGNHEQFMFGWERAGTDALELAHRAWTRSQLQPEHFGIMRQWQPRYICRLEGVSVCCQHYAFDPTESAGLTFRPYFPPEPALMDEYFDAQNTNLVFFGHLHRPVEVQGATTRYYGLMATGTGAKAEASYTIVDFDAGQARVMHKQIAYDDSQLFCDMEACQVPAREFLYQAFFGGRFTPMP